MTSRGSHEDERRPFDLGRHRLRWVLLAGGLIWSLIGLRLVQLQAIDHGTYQMRARNQHQRQIPLSARRGAILDRQGRELAFDVTAVSFYCRPAQVRDPESVTAHFMRFGRRSASAVSRLISGGHPFVYLLRQVDGERLRQVRRKTFEGVYEQLEVRRHYPYGRLAGQLLGFTDIENRGQEGTELAFEEILAERAGSARSYVDGLGNILPERSQPTAAPRHGASVHLTIDAAIQEILEEELARTVTETRAEGALGIIADPRSGEILAMAGIPLFDPNDPGGVPANHRRNRLVTDPFEPGSIFKPITMAAVLDDDPKVLERKVYCEEGAYVLSMGDVIRDVKPHGWMTPAEVVAQSSNIGVIKLAQGLDRSSYYQSLRGFGFGTRTGIGLPAESAGLLRHARDWSNRSLETISIGQEISVTAVQMVQAFSAIANGGMLMAPKVVQEVRDPAGQILRREEPKPVRRVLSARTASVLKGMLQRVVSDGTGRNAAIEGVRVAGKTGTAQRALPGGGGYAQGEYIASFIGFLPATGQPRYLCLISVENPRVGKWGGVVAAPAFRRTMERILILDGSQAPGGSRPDALADAGTEVRGDVVPDFRGLDVPRVRVQARRRDLNLRFEGSGPIVVGQEPAPRSRLTEADILCRLGSRADLLALGLPEAPMRQAVLVRKLQGPQLVALAPGEARR